MKVQLISSRTYSSCSSLKTWALNYDGRALASCSGGRNKGTHLLLELLVGVVNAKLLEAVLLKVLKAVDIL